MQTRERRVPSVSPRKKLEQELHQRSHALAERIKELDYLHSVSDLFADQKVDLGEVFQRVVELLPSALQHPEIGCARISLKNRVFQSPDFGEPVLCERQEIIVGDGPIGEVEIGYREVFPDGSGPTFLPGEKDVLITLSQRLAEAYQLKESQMQLATYQQHLRSLASELTLAEERERRQLALHLHDNIGQGLAVTKLKLETLRHVLPAEYTDRVEDILALLQRIIADTRSITAQISPPILYELSFYQAIGWLAEYFQKQFGLAIEVIGTDEEFALGEGARVMLFRSIQELLTNVVKHAQATAVTIRLERRTNEVHASVEDNGIGFDAGRQGSHATASGGFGLFSIRERFAHLGGGVAVDSHPGQGARILLWIPVADRGDS